MSKLKLQKPEVLIDELGKMQRRYSSALADMNEAIEAMNAWQEDSQSKQRTIDELFGILEDKQLNMLIDKVFVAVAAAAGGLIIGAALSKYL